MTTTLENTGDTGALKVHVYARDASTELSTFQVTATNAILAASSHFKKVDAGFELVSSKGDAVTLTTGSKFVTTSEMTGSIKAYGLTSVDYNALMHTTTGMNLKDQDIFLLQAPTSQASGTCAVGQSFFAVYSVNCFVFLELKGGVPIAVNVVWERTDSASDTNIKWDTIVVDP